MQHRWRASPKESAVRNEIAGAKIASTACSIPHSVVETGIIGLAFSMERLKNECSGACPGGTPQLCLPYTVALFAQSNCQLHFHVARGIVRHRVIHFIQLRQLTQSIALHETVRLIARLVLVETPVGIEAGHADINAGLALHIIGIRLSEARLVQHILRQFDNIHMVAMARRHRILLSSWSAATAAALRMIAKRRLMRR